MPKLIKETFHIFASQRPYSDPEIIFHFFVFIVCVLHVQLIDVIVFMFIQHNIPCELSDVNVFNGEHREAKFVAMNPHEEVPTLADGSTTVFGGFVSEYSRILVN